MKEATIKRLLDIIPDATDKVSKWFIPFLTEDSKDLLNKASGSVGLLVKIIAIPLLNKYLAEQTKNKLKEFGVGTYLKSAYTQASDSIAIIENKIKSQKTCEDVIEAFARIEAKNFENVTRKNVLLIFQPVYHPIIRVVRESYVEMLEYLGIEQTTISDFKSHFNKNIEETIKKEFGEDYAKHKVEIEDFIFDERESRLLIDTIQLGRIGFSSSEDLEYEETFGYWKSVGELREGDSCSLEEDKLQLVIKLIEDYFGAEEDCLDKILFIIADFGKGKSVFMKRYALLLARQYLSEREGCFPVYFNLREYKNYSSRDNRLGVISDFLQNKYGINIEDEKYINKRFVFLVDSLDESGELTKEAISKVVGSIKQIQNLDRTKYRKNRIIIASRPLNEGFEDEIRCYKPYKMENKENRPIDCYISLYGFKKNQFNNWLLNTLKFYQNFLPKEAECSGFVADILRELQNETQTDIYDILLRNGTLQADELRRPIFAYMIFQLIMNKIDFEKSGKIGVYLSFLNLLTKDAKHINDPSYKVKLEEEFQFRNILHATAALWMYKRHCGEQGFLKKADLCRAIEGKNDGESDASILEKNKRNKVVEIEFLSHSYFGENDNTLYFQHQSFAEILLAEYYLKLFIKYALEKEENVEKARVCLHLGEPTEQTISFFVELLHLLKDAAEEYIPGKEDILEKRKLLFPLLASLSNERFNTLFSNSLYYQWYNIYIKKIDENQIEYPIDALKNWGIRKAEVEKIVAFAAKILNSKYDYIISKIETAVNLFDKDVVIIHNSNVNSLGNTIDKFFSLLIGDVLFTDITDDRNLKLFNTDYKIDAKVLFKLIELSDISNVNHTFKTAWMYPVFRGIDTRNEVRTLKVNAAIYGLDLSYSYFENVIFNDVVFCRVNLSHVTFEDVMFVILSLSDVVMENIILKKDMELGILNLSGFQINSFINLFEMYLDDEEGSPIYLDAKHLYRFVADLCIFLRAFGCIKVRKDGRKILDIVDFIPENMNQYFKEIYNESIYKNEILYKNKIKQILNDVYNQSDTGFAF